MQYSYNKDSALKLFLNNCQTSDFKMEYLNQKSIKNNIREVFSFLHLFLFYIYEKLHNCSSWYENASYSRPDITWQTLNFTNIDDLFFYIY